MDGRFAPYELAETLREVYLLETTGVLHLAREGGGRQTLEFENGILQYAEGEEGEDLGGRLVREERITPGHLAELNAEGVPHRGLAGALLERGWVDGEALAESYAAYLAERLCEPLRWPGGERTFHTQDVEVPPIEVTILNTLDAFFMGMQSMAGFDPVLQALLGLDRPLRLNTHGAVPIERMALGPAQGFALSRLDGSLSLPEILSTLPPYEEEPTARFIYGLLLLRSVTHVPPLSDGLFTTSALLRDYSRDVTREREEIEFIGERLKLTEDASPYVLLGVLEEATPEDIREAYRARKAELHPTAFLPRVRSKLRSELQVLDGRIVQAFLALQGPAASPARATQHGGAAGNADAGEETGEYNYDRLAMRREFLKSESRVSQEEAEKQADNYYLKARKYFQSADYHNCIQYCRLAIRFADSVARYHHLLGEAQVRNPDHRWQKLAEQSFQKASELDPWNADYLVTLGQFYRRQGFTMRARRQFEKALEILPSHPVAQEELAALQD